MSRTPSLRKGQAVNMYLDGDTVDYLERVANRMGSSTSEVVRNLVRHTLGAEINKPNWKENIVTKEDRDHMSEVDKMAARLQDPAYRQNLREETPVIQA